jgi:hypothetical protein
LRVNSPLAGKHESGFALYLELFDDTNLEKGIAYREVIQSLHEFSKLSQDLVRMNKI